MMPAIACSSCHCPYPEGATPYRCGNCGGIFDYVSPFPFNPDLVERTLPGIWRYRHTFHLPPASPIISLGEGNTPLVWTQAFDRKIAFKLEYLNPTGSFKDRGTTAMVSFLVSRGVAAAVEDSSGNAGSSFAAYAARAGITARVFVPDYASAPKRAQISAYGAELVRILGRRSNATEAVRRAADGGAVYASHVFLPFGLAGLATIAYEIVEQLDGPPGVVILPVGQGSLLLGIARGFAALRTAGVIDATPRLIGVQAKACAPLWAVFTTGPTGLNWVTEGETLAEGVRIKHPQRGDAVLQAVDFSDGMFVVVEEDQIRHGREALASRGLFVEPTSAIVWDGVRQVVETLQDPIVVILTGSGYKSIPLH